MERIIPAAIVLSVLMLNLTINCLSQTDSGNWTEIEKLRPTAYIFVVKKNGETFRGNFEALKSDQLMISTGKNPVAIGRGEVKRIYLGVPKSGKRAGNIGAIIGAIAGYAIGLAIDGAIDKDTMYAAGTTLGGAFGGYLIGKKSANGFKKGRLLFEAK